MSFWSQDKIEELKRLWSAGHSANVIYRLIGAASRNAVISKCHRLGLTARTMPVPDKIMKPSTLTSRGNGGQRLEEKVKQLRALASEMAAVDSSPPVVADEPLGVLLLELEDKHCRWPITEARGIETRFCGQPRSRGSYCSTHYNLSRNKQPNHGNFAIRRRKAA